MSGFKIFEKINTLEHSHPKSVLSCLPFNEHLLLAIQRAAFACHSTSTFCSVLFSIPHYYKPLFYFLQILMYTLLILPHTEPTTLLQISIHPSSTSEHQKLMSSMKGMLYYSEMWKEYYNLKFLVTIVIECISQSLLISEQKKVKSCSR